MLLKKIILILEALLMTAFVMAEEKPMKKKRRYNPAKFGFQYASHAGACFPSF